MNAVNYSNARYPVRANFAETHNRFWDRLASPGAWLDGSQKVAVAREIRQSHDCALCQQRRERFRRIKSMVYMRLSPPNCPIVWWR